MSTTRTMVKTLLATIATLFIAMIAAGSNASTVAAGNGHSCAVINGGVKCWGDNTNGQLGNNSTTQRLVPVQAIAALSNVTAVSAANGHSCAVVNGGAQCWGNNGSGRLGNNSITQSLVPVQAIAALSNVTAVSAGGSHSCAVVNGGVQCWGSNGNGRLGNNSITDSLVPVQAIAALSNATAVSAAAHSCAVVNGGVQCWGGNGSGQLGNNSTTQSLVPVQTIAALSNVTAVSAGGLHSCAVVNGGVQCWGGNVNGQLGNNSTTPSLVPVQTIAAGSNATAVSAGNAQSCAVVNGGVQCWGINTNGALGNNSVTQSLVPVQTIAALSNVTMVDAGLSHGCAAVNGALQCWGNNGNGQLGNNSTTQSLVPVTVASVPDAPTGATAVAGISSATVNYTPPAFNGGATITTYTATANPGGITGNATGGPILVTGLTNGTPYTFTVTATNAVGTSPPSAPSNSVTPAAPPPPSFAYITNQTSNNVSVINTATNTVVATVAVGANPIGVAVSPAGNRAYVLNTGSSNFSVIDTVTNTVVATVAAGPNPRGVAFNPSGISAYVTTLGNNVLVVDTTTNTVVATVPVGNSPEGVAVNPAGTRVYVANSGSNNVSVVDTATNTVVATVAVAVQPSGVAVNPAGTRVYVTNVGLVSNNVSVIDTATNTVVATVPVGINPRSVAVNPGGTFAYVANAGNNNVSVIDTATNTVVATVAVGVNPLGVAVNPAGTSVYVPNQNSNTVSVINTATNTVVAAVAVGAGPNSFGLFIGTPPVITVPGAPVIGTATAGNGSATVNYSPPASNGGSTIFTYTATSNPGGIQGFATGGPIIVSGLTNGTPYTFTVTATNAVGVGPPSAPSNSVTPMLAGAVCQFNQTIGPWTTPANWNNCGTGNGVPAGTPGPADRAEINSGLAFLPPGTFSVGDIYMVNGTIQGAGIGATTLNIVAGGTIAGGSGTYTFEDVRVTITAPTPMSAISGPWIVDLSQVDVNPGTTLNLADVTIVGAGARFNNSGFFFPFGTLTMASGGVFENTSAGVFVPAAPMTISGTFVNNGAFLTNSSHPITLVNAAGFSQPASSGFIGGDGTLSAVGQTLTIAAGFIEGDATFDVGTLNNTGAIVSPGGFGVIGQLIIIGNYTVSGAGSLEIDIAADVSMPVADEFVVGGTSTITGSNVDFYYIDIGFGPYVPTVGDALFFFTNAPQIGTFATFSAPVSANVISLSYFIGGAAFLVTAPAPAVTVTGTTTFPNTVVATLSGVQPITITNSGTGTLTLSLITASNVNLFFDTTSGPAPNAAHWCGFGSAVGGAPNTGAPINIAPGGTCVLNLIFAPNAVGALSGTITVTSNAPTSPNIITVTGTGLAVAIPVITSPTTAGGVVGSAFSYQITATNTPTSFGATGLPAGLSVAGATGLITGTPTAAGSFTATVNATNGGGTGTQMVTITIAAVATPSMTVAFAPTSVAVNTNASMTLTLTNPGGSPAFISGGSITIPAGLTATPPGSNTCGTFGSVTSGIYSFGMGNIPAMGSCTIVLTVQSPTPGGYTATVSPGALNAGGANTNTSVASLTVTAAGTGPYAYVPNFNSFSGTTVSVIDTPTNTVVSTVTVGAGPVTAVVNYAGTRAYISNQQSNNISVIDTSTNAVVATVPVGSSPAGVAVNPAGTRVYSPNQTSNNVTVIDATTNSVITTIAGLSFPVGAIVNPAGSKVYVATFSANAVAVINTATNTILATIPVCASPFLPLMNPTGTRLYVACTSGNVAVIDASNNTVIATIPVGSNTRGITINAAGTVLYATNNGSNNISVISTASNTVTGTISAPGGPLGGALNPANTRLYVANSSANTVSVFDTGTNALVATIPVGPNPFGVGIVPAAVVPTPGVSLAPASVNFGARTTNTTSPPSTVTVTNSGTANLIITSITGSGDFGFTSTCPISTPPVVPAGTCAINITFTPLTAAALVGTITIASNAPGSPHTIALSGVGSAVAVPGISLSALTLSFGAQTINTASLVQSVIVANTGFANLLISAITVGAPFSRVPLGIVTPPDCGVSVAPSSSCQIGVNFTPTAIGAATGQISITDNATGSPHLVALNGTGTAIAVPVIAASSTVAFGDQIVNTTGSLQNVISNTGTGTLNISAITLTGPDAARFTLAGQSGCASIAPLSSCTLAITFTPTSTGAKTAQINITSNAQNAALVNAQSLTGNGILAPRAVVNVTSTTIGFGNVIFGGATPSQTVTLTNTGGQVMNISSIVVSGDFVRSTDCGATLASLASCTVSIAFTPLGQGSRFGELTLNTNTTTSPDRIPLSGTGCRWFSQTQSRFFLTSC